MVAILAVAATWGGVELHGSAYAGGMAEGLAKGFEQGLEYALTLPRCLRTTASGRQCRNPSKAGYDACGFHLWRERDQDSQPLRESAP